MAIREYDFVVGPETSTLPTVGTPTVDTDIITKGYADDTYTAKAQVYGVVADVTALKAIAPSERFDAQWVIVDGKLALYRFDAASVATPDDDLVVQPNTGSGRWTKEIGDGSGGGGGSAAGSNTQVQYNNSGAFGASSSFTYDGTKVTVPNILNSGLTASKPVFTDSSKNLVSTGTLGVDQGGTGLSTTTAYSIVFTGTTSTGNFQASDGPGTSGYILTSNGAGALPTWQAPAVSGVSQAKATMISMIFGY